MNKHLEEVTPKKLIDFREDPENFTTFASSLGNRGFVRLGVSGKGNYITKLAGEPIIEYANSLQAVEAYKKLIS